MPDAPPSSKPRPLRAAAPDVLVVGAGPTGLTLACELLRHGVRCRLVDRAQDAVTESRALGVQSQSLEVFHAMGVADALLAEGTKVFGLNVYADEMRLVHATFDDLDTPYPFVLSVPQATTERVLRERFAALGGRVERGLGFRSLTLHDEGVAATLENGRREEVVQTPWLVGCDGSHSAVRKALGLPFEGARYEETFILGDVELVSHLATDELHVFLSPAGVLAVIPLPGERRVRLVADAPPERVASGEEPVTIETLRAILAARGLARATIESAAWATPFHIHRRITPSYRVGRAFLAGDAAHIHSPVGGQGMNTGIQDAYNLAWKLALVIKGHARPELLDSYEVERRPIAAATLEGTDIATRIVTLRHAVSREVRNQVARIVSSFVVVKSRIAGSAAQLHVRYAKSPVVAEHRPSLLRSNVFPDRTTENPSVRDWLDFGAAAGPGERAPDVALARPAAGGATRLFDLLCGTRHTLLLFDGGAPTPEGYKNLSTIATQISARWPDLIDVHVVVPRGAVPPELTAGPSVVLDEDGALHDRYGAGSECLYLIRPDGYVAFRSQPAALAPLEEYLARLFIR